MRPPLTPPKEGNFGVHRKIIVIHKKVLYPAMLLAPSLWGRAGGEALHKNMKSVFIAYDQAYQEKILFTLDHFNCRGFSMFPQVQGRGSKTGEPHYGSHAWPSMCSAILTVVRDEQVDPLLEELHRIDMQTERLGLRAFVWDVEKSI